MQLQSQLVHNQVLVAIIRAIFLLQDTIQVNVLQRGGAGTLAVGHGKAFGAGGGVLDGVHGAVVAGVCAKVASGSVGSWL